MSSGPVLFSDYKWDYKNIIVLESFVLPTCRLTNRAALFRWNLHKTRLCTQWQENASKNLKSRVFPLSVGRGQRSGVVAGTAASHQEGSGSNPDSGVSRFSPGTPASSNSPKTCKDVQTGNFILSSGVNACSSLRRPCDELVTCAGCTLPSTCDSLDRLQPIPPACYPECSLSGDRKWMSRGMLVENKKTEVEDIAFTLKWWPQPWL